nr:hypothetical protein [Enterobacter roggenkampii]
MMLFHAYYHLLTDQASEIYKEWLIETINACDLAFAISENTKRDLKHFSTEHGLELPPVTVVRLGDEVPTTEGDPSADIVQKISEPYLLTVGSIEYRKNHIMLLNAWRYMIEEQNYIPPKLYIVGKQGWLDNDIEYQIANDLRLKGRIEVLKGLQDIDLRVLYENSMFTFILLFMKAGDCLSRKVCALVNLVLLRAPLLWWKLHLVLCDMRIRYFLMNGSNKSACSLIIRKSYKMNASV